MIEFNFDVSVKGWLPGGVLDFAAVGVADAFFEEEDFGWFLEEVGFGDGVEGGFAFLGGGVG